MELLDALRSQGFDPVFVLNGSDCGIPERRLVIACMRYEAEAEVPRDGAWIHPYYDVSQRAYRAAQALVRTAQAEGYPLASRDDIRVKPIFARMPEMQQGRNTLSYLPEIGSRFHVQVFTCGAELPVTTALLGRAKPLHCGSCRLCEELCPTGAVREDGFHRERCLRNWQLNGRPVPEALRAEMGSRLIGCDDCQRCCPHEPAPAGPTGVTADPAEILADGKAASAALGPRIGTNLALPNRLLAQAALIAANTHRTDCVSLLERLTASASEAVREHARWALRQLTGDARSNKTDP